MTATTIPLTLGALVEFTDRYDKTLVGVAVKIDRPFTGGVDVDVTVWVPSTLRAYGMPPCRIRTIGGVAPAARLTNLIAAEAQTRDVYAAYPAWQARFLAQSPYRFYGDAIDAVAVEVATA